MPVMSPPDTLLYSFDWDNNGTYESRTRHPNAAATTLRRPAPLHGGRARGGRRRRRGDGHDDGGGAATDAGRDGDEQRSGARRAQPATVTATGTQELGDTLLYSFDWDNNGSYEVTNQTSNVAATSFAATGSLRGGACAWWMATAVWRPARRRWWCSHRTLGVTATNNGPVRNGQPAAVTTTGTQELEATRCSIRSTGTTTGLRVTEPDIERSGDELCGDRFPYVVGVNVVDGDSGVATGTTTVVVQPQTLGVTATNNGPVQRSQPATVTATGTQNW